MAPLVAPRAVPGLCQDHARAVPGPGLISLAQREGGEELFPSRLPLPSRLLGSELCNAARTARLLCVNPINISWSCFLQGKGCSQLRLSAASTSREHLISFHQHPADPPRPPHWYIILR